MSLPSSDLSGGPSTHLPLLRAGLEREGVQILPFNYTRRKDQETKLEKLRGRTVDLMRFFYLVLRHRPDLVHHNSAFDPGTLVRDGLLCLVAKLLNVPVFIKIHGSHRSAFGRVSAFKAAMRGLVVKVSVGLGVLSEAEKQEFTTRWPKLSGRVHVVKNVVRDEFIQAQVREHGRTMVFFTSRFVKEKGMFDLLEAVAAVLVAHPECRFTFIGGGPDAATFVRRVDQLRLNGSVTYLPNKSFSELIELYRLGGIFVFPSHFPEGMPMALIEAMAVGLLAVSSSVRFVREVPSFAGNPMLLLDVAKDVPSQIARSINHAVGNQNLREQVGLMNKQFAKQYSQKIVAKDFVELYDKLARRRST